MNRGQFKHRLCYLCLPGTVLALLSLIEEIVSSNTTFYIQYFLDSVKFRLRKLEWNSHTPCELFK